MTAVIERVAFPLTIPAKQVRNGQDETTRLGLTVHPEYNRDPEIRFNFGVLSKAKHEYVYARSCLDRLEDTEEKQALAAVLKPFSVMQGWNLPTEPLEEREDPDISIQTLQSGLTAFQDIVVALLPLVKHLMKTTQGITWQNFDDAYSAGIIGLIDAIGKHQPDAPCLVFGYAEKRIKGEIIDYLRRTNALGRAAIKNLGMLNRAEDALTIKNQEHPTEAQIAAEAGLPLDVAREARMEKSRMAVSFDKPANNESLNGRSLMLEDIIAGEENIEGDVVSGETRAELFRALYRLPGRDREILRYYYGEGMIMKEIAEKMGVSETRVTQLHKVVIRRLQKDMGITGRKETPRRVVSPSEFAALTAPTASLNLLAQEKRARLRNEALKRIANPLVTPTIRLAILPLIESDGMVLLRGVWATQIRPNLDPSMAMNYINTTITVMRPKLEQLGITLDSIYLTNTANSDKRPSAVQLVIKNTQRR